MSDTAELNAEGGELNVQAIDEGPSHEESAGEQAAVGYTAYHTQY